jgi:hypothetical protein
MMAKGFGVYKGKQLGYVLVLLPSASAYAAKLSIDDGSGEEFIGVTSMLEQAQVWKQKQQAKQAIDKYVDFLLEQIASRGEARVLIKRLQRLGNGHLEEETVETLVLMSGDFDTLPKEV